jgi:hypothetical protein
MQLKFPFFHPNSFEIVSGYSVELKTALYYISIIEKLKKDEF